MDFGRVDLEVIAAQTAALPENEPLPASDNTVNVSNASELTSALASAAPGDHIVLASGSYGSFTINNGGTSGSPIVVRAANLLGATFSRLTISADWVIVSGVSCDLGAGAETGSPLVVNGSDTRVTRSQLANGGIGINYWSGITSSLIDHCEVTPFRDYRMLCADPKDQDGLTIARCWFHDAVEPLGGKTQIFAFGTENMYREKDLGVIVRFNYVGPGLPNPLSGSDPIHAKTSGPIYAFNHWDNDFGNKLLHNRFGLRNWFIANYGPAQVLLMYDYDCWALGNLISEIRMRGGNSNLYDETKNAIFWNGIPGNTSIFHALQRGRVAGN